MNKQLRMSITLTVLVSVSLTFVCCHDYKTMCAYRGI